MVKAPLKKIKSSPRKAASSFTFLHYQPEYLHFFSFLDFSIDYINGRRGSNVFIFLRFLILVCVGVLLSGNMLRCSHYGLRLLVGEIYIFKKSVTFLYRYLYSF